MGKHKLVKLKLEKKKKKRSSRMSQQGRKLQEAGRISASQNLLSQTSAATELLLQKRGRKIAVLKGKDFARPHMMNLTIKC
jgi:hypothetical protein